MKEMLDFLRTIEARLKPLPVRVSLGINSYTTNIVLKVTCIPDATRVYERQITQACLDNVDLTVIIATLCREAEDHYAQYLQQEPLAHD